MGFFQYSTFVTVFDILSLIGSDYAHFLVLAYFLFLRLENFTHLSNFNNKLKDSNTVFMLFIPCRGSLFKEIVDFHQYERYMCSVCALTFYLWKLNTKQDQQQVLF